MVDSVFKQCLDAVVTALQDINMSTINDTSIVVRKLPWDDNYIHRGVTVSWGEPMPSASHTHATNERDLLGYPCIITLVQGTGRGWSDEMERVAKWRQQIFRTFNNKRLSGVTATDVNDVICRVEPGDPTIPQRYLENYDVSQMVVWCWFLEPRTLETTGTG